MLSPQSVLSCSSVFTMNLNTRHKQSFLQLAKTFITFSGKNKNKERKTNEEEQKMHRTLRKTLSLGSSGVDMKKEPDIWFDLNHDTNNGENKVFKETKKINESQNSFKTKYSSQKTRVGKDQNSSNSHNSFKPKYHSQKVRGGRDLNEHQLLPKHRVKLRQLPEKVGRRKFSLKGHRGGKLQRTIYNISCPDLASPQGELGRGDNILDSVDKLDRNTVHMFRDKQYLETELIEIYFE